MASSTSHRRSRPHHRASASPSSEAVKEPAETASGRGAKPKFWLGLAVLVPLIVGSVWAFSQWGGRRAPQLRGGPVAEVPDRYDPDRAFGYLEQICAIGPRVTATDGMQQQQEMLTQFFQQRGAEVELQRFEARHPLTGKPTEMANLIARFGIDRPKRYLICAHYDTRPYPDRDPVDPRGVFLGANDGGSGVAALMELSHHLDDLPADVGVDLVMFDAEELVYDSQRDPYFLGSTHFAREYLAKPPARRYRAGILLDMVGDAEQHLFIEINSWRYAKPVVREVWATAERLGVSTFYSRLGHEVRDDHLPLNQIAKIPTIDIIDFDYPRPSNSGYSYWHTRQDIPANCSGPSIVNVVYVVHTWLGSR